MVNRALLIGVLCAVLLAGLLGHLGALQAQTQRPARDTSAQGERPEGTGRISGLVVAADTGRPVKRARVVASARDFRGRYSVQTDERGRYEVTELPAGRYTLSVSKAGFVTLSYGQRRPRQPATPVQLSDGEALRRVNFNLPRGSVITGHVLDEDGEPLTLASVRLLQYVFRQGQRQLVPAGADRSDDRGEYRIFGLEPGDYYVSADVPRQLLAGPRQIVGTRFGGGGGGGRGVLLDEDRGAEEVDTVGYASSYYPGVTTLSEAVRVTVGLSQEATGIDFPIQLVPTASVSGHVVDPNGVPAVGAQVTLLPDDGPSPFRGSLRGGRVQNDGTFRVTNVAPGRYALRARSRGRRGVTPLFASEQITVVGQEVSDLILMLSQGANVAGSVIFETTTMPQPDDLTRIRVTAPSLDPVPFGGNSNARVQEDGTFLLSNVAAGPRLIRANGAPREWLLKAVYLEGRDVTDTPLDFGGVQDVDGVTLVFSDRVSELSGVVHDGQGQALTDFTVVAFPTDSALWQPRARQIQASRPDQTGRYQIRGLPPGQYLLAAVEVVQQGEWYDPSFLERLRSGAARISIREGEIKALDLELGTQ